MDMDHPNTDVRTEKDEIDPEGTSPDLLYGVRRALVVIVVFHS
jgi:proteasome lid subunit RPN8/RPN11